MQERKFVQMVFVHIFSVRSSRTVLNAVILLPAHPASFAHNFVSGMQSFYFSESQDAIVLQTCDIKIVFWTHKFAVRLIDMENSKSQKL